MKFNLFKPKTWFKKKNSNPIGDLAEDLVLSVPGVSDGLGEATGTDVGGALRPRPDAPQTLTKGFNQAYEYSSGQTTDNAFQLYAPAGSPTNTDQFQVYTYYKTVEGTNSADTIYGNTDLKNSNGGIIFDAIAETINAKGGNDTVYGREGNDRINGEAGDDNLFGGPGFDTIIGGQGSDFMSTGTISSSAEGEDVGKREVLTGGPGADTFFWGERPGDAPLESDNVNVGNGVNWGRLALSLAGDISDLGFTRFLPGQKIAKEIMPMIFDVTKAFTGASSQPEPLTGGSFAKITDFDPREDVLLIPTDKTKELIFSKDTTSDSDITIKYQDGNGLNLLGTIALTSDFSDTQAVNSVINSLQQNSLTIDSNKVSQGDTNSSQTIFQTGTGATQIAASAKEDLGNTRFKVIGAFSGLEQTGSNSSEYMYGTKYGDVLAGYQLDNEGGTSFSPQTAGNDEFRGYGGDDFFYGGAGSNKFFGGEGSDTVLYVHSQAGINANLNLANNKVYAEVSNGFGGTDQLYSIENIVGSDYTDTIVGNNAPNVLASAKGNDEMRGNGGADTFVFSTGDTDIDKMGVASAPDFGTKTIKDFNPAEDKIQIDVKAYYDHYKSVDFDATHSDTNNTLTISIAGQEAAILENISNSQVADALQKIEFIGEENTSGRENTVDILIGNNNNNHIFGVGGQDYVYGSAGNDTLLGGRGDDVMLGGDGNDLLRGFEQNDILIGGRGADRFQFQGYDTNGFDTILDFTASEGDKIQIKKNDYGISSHNDLSLNSDGELLANNTRVIAVLENAVGFNINNSVQLV
ncbi:calcium-binding protein [Dapis sp. BLCC M229]|uniref:calcium-binding protein n=1 Tax=Dapis sp. BLCC M229 TaxID=3400188 RepID=UPI003CED20D1